VDEFFQSHAKWKNRILESHPEVCFERLTGKVLSTSKHDFKGIGERADILHEYCQDISAAWIAEQAEKLKCNEDDIADAVCLSIVANLHAQHKTETIPEQPMKDKTGLLMQMIVPKIMEQ
jgi:8-oxo-dGTP diphosphatase